MCAWPFGCELKIQSKMEKKDSLGMTWPKEAVLSKGSKRHKVRV